MFIEIKFAKTLWIGFLSNKNVSFCQAGGGLSIELIKLEGADLFNI